MAETDQPTTESEDLGSDSDVEKSEKKSEVSDEEILETARKRFSLAIEAEDQIRKDALDDMRFRSGDQWPQDIKNERVMDRRPCLTINRLPQYIRQVTNDQRQNRQSIRVSPVDDMADQETAKILQGLIRHIEYDSNADVAYDTAFEGATSGGFGYFRIITQFCDPMSFNQDIKIKRIRNHFSVVLDPTYQEPDGSDANWGFVIDDMSVEEHKSLFPNSKLSSMTDWETVGNQAPGWMTESKTCRVAEYFYKTLEEVEIGLLNNGRVVELSKIDEKNLPEGYEITKKRKTIMPKIKWVKMNGVEILERTDWLGQWIPIIPVLGDEIDVNGKRILESLIRHAKDPQRMYNFWATAETEVIALAPRAPFIGVEGQFEGHEATWNNANRKNYSYLQYKPVSIAGVPAPPPQRNSYEPPVMAITQARVQSAEDLKATTGMYDATMGMRSNETSGVAIQRRNNQSQTSNFHFIDNLRRSRRHAGRIIVELIPYIYDTARAVRILGEDGSVEIVKINQLFEKNGTQKTYRFDLGKYDVTIDDGPSFATKRQESVQNMLALIQAYPQAAQVAGDLMVKNMDWPGSTEIAERLKKALPPGLVEEKDGKSQQIPPQVQAQLQQMGQMVDALTKELNGARTEIEQKTREIESKERIEFAKMKVDVEKTLAAIGQKDSATLLMHQMTELQNRMDILEINEPIEETDSGVGSNGAGVENQQPTGGTPPGQPMGV